MAGNNPNISTDRIDKQIVVVIYNRMLHSSHFKNNWHSQQCEWISQTSYWVKEAKQMTLFTRSSRKGKLSSGYRTQNSGYLWGRVSIDWERFQENFCSRSWSGGWLLGCIFVSIFIELRASICILIIYQLYLNIKCKTKSLQLLSTQAFHY